MRGIVRDCVSEMLARKIFWVFVVITILMVTMIILAGVFSYEFDPAGQEDLGAITYREHQAAGLAKSMDVFLWVLVVMTVFMTAGQFPSMLEPGRAEYYLAKPISRGFLFCGKFIGILIAYGALIGICGLIASAAIYIVFGFSSINLLYVYLLNIAALLIWLSISTFAGIVFGTTSMAIVSVAAVWFAQFALNHGRDKIKALISTDMVHSALDVMYYIMPKTGKIDDMGTALALGAAIRDWMPLYSSLLFAFGLTVLTVILFKRKNY